VYTSILGAIVAPMAIEEKGIIAINLKHVEKVL